MRRTASSRRCWCSTACCNQNSPLFQIDRAENRLHPAIVRVVETSQMTLIFVHAHRMNSGIWVSTWVTVSVSNRFESDQTRRVWSANHKEKKLVLIIWSWTSNRNSEHFSDLKLSKVSIGTSSSLSDVGSSLAVTCWKYCSFDFFITLREADRRAFCKSLVVARGMELSPVLHRLKSKTDISSELFAIFALQFLRNRYGFGKWKQ